MWLARALLIVAAVAALAACAPNPNTGDNTMIAVITDKAEDEATVTVENGQALIDVTSPSGIGAFEATLVSGVWPDEITVRLHLRGLEQLEIAYDRYTLSTGVSSHSGPGPALMLTVANEDGSTEKAPPSADMWYPTITVGGGHAGATIPLPPEGSFDVTLPSHFHAGAYPSFRMRWIDFYR
jgi:hypothetical protein